MTKRFVWSLLLVAALLAVATPVALAYGSASGQVNDRYGVGWTHGGTVTCTHDSNGEIFGTGSIQPDGSWSAVLTGVGATTCTIDPAPGPAGDPAPFVCLIPQGGGQDNYACGATNIPNGPNAVTVAGFAGSSLAGAWLLIPAGLGVALLLWTRRR